MEINNILENCSKMEKELKENMKFSELMYKARIKAIEKKMYQFWMHKLEQEPEKLMGKYIGKYRDELFDYTQKSGGKKYECLMVTINLKEDVDLQEVIKKTKKCIKKVWINKYLYCYEVRGENRGLHIHMKLIIRDNKKIYDCKREIYNTYKHLVGNKLHVNMRYSKNINAFEDYILGYKEGELKEHHRDSVIYRDENGLMPYYSNYYRETIE